MLFSAVMAFGFVVGSRSLNIQMTPHHDMMKPIGDAAVFSCETDSSNVGFVWTNPRGIFHTGQNSPQQPRVYVEDDADGSRSRLYISELEAQDSGIWSCQARSDGVSVKKEILLELYQGISFEGTAQVQEAIEGRDFLLHCEVAGSPFPTVSFRHDGQRVTLSDGDHYMQVNGGLLIRNVQETDAGTYQCMAQQQSLGTIDAIDIELEVVPGPVDT